MDGSSFNEKLVKSYNLVTNNGDIVDLLTGLLYSVHEYSHAQIIARQINHRQGKQRSTYNDESQFMDLFQDEPDDEITEIEKFVEKLNLYLSDKHDLPKSEKACSGIINKIKAMVIILFKHKLHELLDQLNLPEYIEPYIGSAFNIIEDNQENTLNSWINYLNSSNNKFLVDIVILDEDNFWGNYGVDSNDIFNKHFGSVKDEINDYESVYEMFCYYRREYMRLAKNMEIQKLCDIFEINKNQYDKGRKNFIDEFSMLVNKEDEEINLINKVVYER